MEFATAVPERVISFRVPVSRKTGIAHAAAPGQPRGGAFRLPCGHVERYLWEGLSMKLLAVLLIGVTGGPALAAGWPMYGHDVRQSRFNAGESLIGPREAGPPPPPWFLSAGGPGTPPPAGGRGG